MASKVIRGITIEIGGDTTKLGKALESSEKQSRSLQSELRQVDKLLKLDPTNVELLAQRQEILTQAIKETSDKLKILKDAEEQVVAQFEKGEIGESQLRAFQREIIKTENELNGFRGELDGTSSDIKDVGDTAEESSGGFTVMKGALADMIANVITGAISKIGDLIGSLLDLSEATEEYRTMQAKLEGSSNSFGYSLDFTKSKYEEFYKYLGDDQMATNAVTNLLGIGTSTDSLSKIAEGATAAWATYGDSIPIESLTESINETITCGKVTGTFADTINWCKDANVNLKSALDGNKTAQKAYTKALKEGESVEDAFNAALEKVTDEQERADIVARFLNDTYGDTKTTFDEVNESILDTNESELELKDTQADLGDTMSPVNNALTDMKNKALQAITPLVKKLAQGFMDLYNWIQKNPTAMKIITAIVVSLAAAFTVLAGALAIQGIINGVSKAMAFLNTTMLANPIVLIVAAIAALVAGFIYLWNNCEGFRNFFIEMWEKIKQAFQSFVDWISPAIETIKGFFTSLWEKIKEIWSSISASLQPLVNSISGAFQECWELIKVIWNYVEPYFTKIWENIKRVFSVVQTVLSTYFKNAWDAIKLVWSVVVSYFKTIWENIKIVFSVVKTFFSGMFSAAWTAIKAVWNGVVGYFAAIWNSIKNIFSVVKNVLTGNWQGAWNGIKKIVGTWVNYFKSIWNSIKNVFGSVKSWFSSTFSSAWTAVRKVFSNWGSFFSGLWSKIKNTFSKIGTNIASAIGGSVKAGINGVISMIQNTINSGIGMINGAIGLINKIPGVSIGKFNKVSLPRLAEGGVVNRPTIAEIGENGKEAIIPLEKNTEWIDRLAQRLNHTNVSMAEYNALLIKFDELVKSIKNIKMVLNNGTLVGELIDDIDKGLADKQLLTERGV